MNDNLKTYLKGFSGMLLTSFSDLTLDDVDSALSIISTVGIFSVTVYKLLKNKVKK